MGNFGNGLVEYHGVKGERCYWQMRQRVAESAAPPPPFSLTSLRDSQRVCLSQYYFFWPHRTCTPPLFPSSLPLPSLFIYAKTMIDSPQWCFALPKMSLGHRPISLSSWLVQYSLQTAFLASLTHQSSIATYFITDAIYPIPCQFLLRNLGYWHQN